MAIPITVPRLGWDMAEGLFAGWLKQDGEPVRAGEMLFRLESNKATEEIESFDSGILRIPPDGPREGDKVVVGAVIGYLVQPGEAATFPDRPREPLDQSAGNAVVAPVAGPAARRLARELGVDLDQIVGSGASGRITAQDVQKHAPQPSAGAARLAAPGLGPAGHPKGRAGPTQDPPISPRARRVAAELGLDWTRLRGSGKTGRIRERDVRAAAERKATAPGSQPRPRAVPLSPTRRIIAERMLHSVHTTAPVTLTARADATNLVNLRGQFQASQVERTPVPTYTDFLVKLAAIALKKHPPLNARWEADQIVLEPDIHIGIAVDTEAGLLVPVIRDVAGLGLRQLAACSRDLAERARQRKLSAEEMQGGTFTVTNLGAFGIEAFTPIINYPEVAILGVGRIQRQPVVVDNEIVARDLVTLSLTFDHRIVDGGPAARFLQAFCQLIENPGPCLIP